MRRLTPFVMLLASSLFLVATVAMANGREPFATWYYSFAWWSYILFADAWLYRRGHRTALLGNPNAALVLAFSVAIWVTFEIYNFRLQNWVYVEIPSGRPLRWFGYALAYATVLPGLFVTAELLSRLVPERWGGGETALASRRVPWLAGLGLAASVLPLIWPRHLFPLVWLGPTLLFALWNFWCGEGLLVELRREGPRRIYLLALAGLLCGLLWEWWNYWARSKWVYEIPFFDWAPIFEMPVAGFLGFPPFAVECYEMYIAGRRVHRRLAPSALKGLLFWLLVTLYVALGFLGIDAFTVRSFQR